MFWQNPNELFSQPNIIQTVDAVRTQRRASREHGSGRTKLFGEDGQELHLEGFGRTRQTPEEYACAC